MAITKSAKKALRQNVKRRARNAKIKQTLRALLKRMRSLAAQRKIDEAKSLLSQLYKALDKAAKRRVIEKNTASRYKSRLTKLLAKAS